MLEQTVEELERDINQKKANIRSIADKILSKFEKTNKDVQHRLSQKYKYLVEKLLLSKKLLAITEEVKQLKQAETQKPEQDNG